ncbi:MAG: phosphoribosylformylglycinamidine synthase subunit PurQ [Proteobacteria bacterium]|nr:phosphoribosylformylglycinamidine synthase subunit PurQ [Pseudomonadota bacterium]
MAKCLVLAGFGINCELESRNALILAGAKSVDIVHISELTEGNKRLKDYKLIVFPGGFLDGDDLGSAKVQVNRFKYAKIKDTQKRLVDDLFEFVAKDNLAIGICNGFQFMTKAGILPKPDLVQRATLTFNDSGKFEDRWVYLKVNKKSKCVFTKGLEGLYLPVRHGEGKFFCEHDTLTNIMDNYQVVLQYADESYNVTAEYPYNPNGSLRSIAGICDNSGRLFGLMPHPEAFIYPVNHPRWTREDVTEPDGLKIFKNAINYLR